MSSSVIRVEYPDFSSEDLLNEFSVTGNTLDTSGLEDRRSIIEVQSGDEPVTLTGGSLNDTIIGGVGDDSISGGAGNDNLIGGIGRDNLSGGDGNDVLTIASGDTVSGGSGVDTIKKFTRLPA